MTEDEGKGVEREGRKQGRLHRNEAARDAEQGERGDQDAAEHQNPAGDHLIDLIGRNRRQPGEQVDESRLQYLPKVAAALIVDHRQVQEFVPIDFEAQHEPESRGNQQHERSKRECLQYWHWRICKHEVSLQQERRRSHECRGNEASNVYVNAGPVEQFDQRNVGEVERGAGCRKAPEPSLQPRHERHPAVCNEAGSDSDQER